MPTNPATSPSIDADRAKLKDLLCQYSVRLGEFTLASGAKSNVYVDARLTAFAPEAMPLIGRVMLAEFARQGWQPEAVGGLTLGADPVAYSVARESLETEAPLKAFTIRKEAKDHGRGRSVEGIEDVAGLHVVILDDVCTTGGSTAKAVERAKEAGMHVLGAACLVDREQGGPELLKEAFGIRLASIYTLAELVKYKDSGLGGEV